MSSWFDPLKRAALDPDNPTADEQFPFSEHNAMVAYLKDKIINKAIDQTDIANEKILVYKSATDNFVFEAQNEITSLNDILDVVISGVPADNEVLAYNSGTDKFINQTAAEAGLALVANVVLEADFNATTFLYATADNTPQPKTIAETLAILDVESGADETDATNVNAAGAVMESDFDATTFLYATADNTPLPKTPAEVMAILSGSAGAEFLFNTKQVGGIVNPTTAQQAATKNYSDTRLFTKEVVTNFTNDYVPIYKTASGKFEMEEQSAAHGLPVVDTTAIVKGDLDGDKRLKLDVGGFTAATTRTASFPDRNFTVCGTDDAMLVNGANAMAADLDMGDYSFINLNGMTAKDVGGIAIWSNTGTLVARLAASPAGLKMYGSLNMFYNNISAIGAIILNNATELTIATGVVTATQSYHKIDTEADAATDDLVTISGGAAGQELTIKATDSARTVVAKNGTGNLQLTADMSLDNANDTLTMIYDGTNWLETGRANNGA